MEKPTQSPDRFLDCARNDKVTTRDFLAETLGPPRTKRTVSRKRNQQDELRPAPAIMTDPTDTAGWFALAIWGFCAILRPFTGAAGRWNAAGTRKSQQLGQDKSYERTL